MTPNSVRKSSSVLAALALFLGSGPALAQMTPLQDTRELNATVHYQGLTDSHSSSPSGFFAFFQDTVSANVEGNPAGSSSAFAFQSSEFFPAGIFFAGSSGGGWSVIPGQGYDALSHVRFKVHTSTCLAYSFYAQVAPGDGGNNSWVEVSGTAGAYIHVASGETTLAGQLPPGDYVFEGKSSVNTSVATFEGGAFAMTWTVTPCPSSLIGTQPGDQLVRCDTTATFCVTPLGPPGSFTYQWRRNLVPLVETAHYVGVTSPCLSIKHACFADVAYYDVVVSNGATNEASRPAHLGITTIAVGVDPNPAGLTFTLGAATPNPSPGSTAFRYDAPAPFPARVAIYDAAGRLVRLLADRVLSASGTLNWDGTTSAGATAVPGVYFLSVKTPDRALTRRIALVR